MRGWLFLASMLLLTAVLSGCTSQGSTNDPATTDSSSSTSSQGSDSTTTSSTTHTSSANETTNGTSSSSTTTVTSNTTAGNGTGNQTSGNATGNATGNSTANGTSSAPLLDKTATYTVGGLENGCAKDAGVESLWQTAPGVDEADIAVPAGADNHAFTADFTAGTGSFLGTSVVFWKGSSSLSSLKSSGTQLTGAMPAGADLATFSSCGPSEGISVHFVIH